MYLQRALGFSLRGDNPLVYLPDETSKNNAIIGTLTPANRSNRVAKQTGHRDRTVMTVFYARRSPYGIEKDC